MITLTKSAAAIIKQILHARDGDYVRFFVRYGGSNQILPNFSIGWERETPKHPAHLETLEGITFFMEDDDAWVLEGHTLHVSYCIEKDEIAFSLE